MFLAVDGDILLYGPHQPQKQRSTGVRTYGRSGPT